MNQQDAELALLAILSVALLVVALRVRRMEGSWLAPGAFFAGFWAIMAVGPVLALRLFWVSPLALAVVMMFVVVVAAGSRMAAAAVDKARDRELAVVVAAVESTSTSGLCAASPFLALLCGLAAIPAAASFLEAVGLSVANLKSVSGWFDAAARLTVSRYSEGFVEPLTARAGMTLVYAGSLFGGVALAFGSGRMARASVVVPVLGGVLVGVLTTMKLVLMLPFILAGAAYLVCRLSAAGSRSSVFNLRDIVRTMIIAALVLAAIVGSMVARYGTESDGLLWFVTEKMVTYGFGHMSVFSAWLDYGGLWTSDRHWGALTFGGLASVAGFGERRAGLYDLTSTNDYTINSNIFTIFRGLIEDFSLPLALVLMMALGWLAGLAYAKVRTESRPSGWWAVLVAFYVVVAWSFATSILTYNSIVAAFAMFLAYCVWSGRRRALV